MKGRLQLIFAFFLVLLCSQAGNAQALVQPEVGFRAASFAWSPYSARPHNHFRMEGPAYKWNRAGISRSGLRSGLRSEASGHRLLVILAAYSDIPFFYTEDYFVNMLTKTGYSYNGGTGCAAEYLKDQFGFDVSIDVVGPVTVSGGRSYYGKNNRYGNDMHPGEMVAEACILAAEEPFNVDFSKYDEDQDGFVDNVFVFYAGGDEAQQTSTAGEEYIWSHSSSLISSDYGKALQLGSVKVNRYSCSSELYRKYKSKSEYEDVMAPIGTFCHELSHALGLVDLYDTDYELSGGTAAGTWQYTAIMDGGNYNNGGNTPPNYNAIDRELLSLTTPEELKPGSYSTVPIGMEGAKTFKITNPKDSKEYYLFECRSKSSNKWDAYIGGEGMLVYHIDKSDLNSMESEVYGKKITSEERWNLYNEVNCRPGVLDESTSKVVQSAEKHQCADLVEADSRSDLNATISSDKIAGIFFPQSGIISIGGENKVKLPFWTGGYSSIVLSNITFTGNLLSFKVSDALSPIPPEPEEPLKEDEPLYIIMIYQTILPKANTIPAGSIIEMRVSNDYGAQEVKWFFNGSAIPDPSDFKAETSGEIRVEVLWPDGSVDYLFKTINVL